MESRKEYTSTDEAHEHVIEDQNHCCLCGTALKFDHQIDYLSLKIKENSHCPSCAIRMKSKEHSLH